MTHPRSSCCRAALVIAALGATQGTARADIPSGSLTASREGDRVRIEVVWHYHGNIESSCDGVLYRRKQNEATDSPHLVFDGDLGKESMACSCGKWFTWEEGMEDATGEECVSSSYFDTQGTCPENHACYCTLHCKPIHDSPCNGSYTYTFTIAGYAPFGYDAEGKIDVTWVDGCCGCASTGMRPHLFMLICSRWAPSFPWSCVAAAKSMNRAALEPPRRRMGM